MKELGEQFLRIWRELKPIQKGILCVVLLFVMGTMSYLIAKVSVDPKAPLYPAQHLSASDRGEIRGFLEKQGILFEEKTEGCFLVPRKSIQRLRLDLGMVGIPNQCQSKGFELFDTNTWIKGDKELQVLEMRALKGQLEKDIAKYEMIKSATVILDMAPSRPLAGEALSKTKASVILSLMPEARLSTSQLRAITYHLAGAVRGLEPHRIAISDTTGKLYQTISPTEKQEMETRSLEAIENLENKIKDLLTRCIEPEHFYLSLQTKPSGDDGEMLSVLVLLERVILTSEKPAMIWQKEVEKRIKVIMQGLGLQGEVFIDFFSSYNAEALPEKKRRIPYTGLFCTVGVFFLALLAIFPLFKKPLSKRKSSKISRHKEDEKLFQFMTQVNLEQIAVAIQNESPENIAFLLSYLQPSRAEQILLALPHEKQEKVLFHLADMEKEDA